MLLDHVSSGRPVSLTRPSARRCMVAYKYWLLKKNFSAYTCRRWGTFMCAASLLGPRFSSLLTPASNGASKQRGMRLAGAY